MLFNGLNLIKDYVYKNSSRSFNKFFKLDIKKFERGLRNGSSREIEDMGKEMAFNLFLEGSKRLTGYKNLLKDYDINVKDIKSAEDFNLLPIVTKKNYLSKYSLEDLVWDKDLNKLHLISVSSGSTGEPFFWPRGLGLEFETALEHELFLKYFFEIDKKSTLFIIGYAMGIYVAGIFTQNSLVRLVQKGYDLTIVSPGADKDSIINIVKKLGSSYDQIIISAYSPFLKDLLDKGFAEGLDWKQFNLKFISGGEGFSEEYRNYIYRKLGIHDYLRSSMNTYGSADAAILGHETPLSILIRSLANKNPKLQKALFKETRTPSLQQYYPFFKYFEEINGDLVFSTYGGIPLIRYSIGDNGGIITFEKMVQTLKVFGIDLEKEMKKHHSEKLIWKLPFVYLFGRKDNTKIFYGANIYPEHIKNCLENEGIIDFVTGKYLIDIRSTRNHNQILYLAVELGQSIKPNTKIKKLLETSIYNNLLEINAEYRYLSQTMGEVIHPTIELYEFAHPKYFKPSIKPHYVKKSKKK